MGLAGSLVEVDRVRDLAYRTSDRIHLMVLSGTLSIDVVVRTGETEAKHLERAIQVAKAVIPKL